MRPQDAWMLFTVALGAAVMGLLGATVYALLSPSSSSGAVSVTVTGSAPAEADDGNFVDDLIGGLTSFIL